MYCKRCGKFIDYQADICNECAGVAQNVAAPVEYQQTACEPQQPEEMQGSVTTGLGKAIASVILGTVGQFFIGIALGLLSAQLGGAGVALVLAMMGIGMSIPALIMGISSMRCFFEEKNAGRKKPIPTLIIGIYGMANAAMCLLLGAIVFFGGIASVLGISRPYL